MTNPITRVRDLGQSIWYDNISRAHLRSGELQRLINLGVSGLTSNPTIFEKAISESTDYDADLDALIGAGKGPSEVFEALAGDDIRAAADMLRPAYDAAGGADGFASFEVSPHLAHDTEGTVRAAMRLFALLDRPNVMIKVPGTPAGIPAIRRLIGSGVNVNVTLIFSLEAYANVREAYISGLEDLAAAGGDVSRVASVASFFVSRVDTSVDAGLAELGGDAAVRLSSRAAVANAKLAYRDFKATFGTARFAELASRGARVQRPLWASTSTKNPALSDVFYVDGLVGPDTVNTMPDVTLEAFLDHGFAVPTLENELEQAEAHVAALEAAGVSMENTTSDLLDAGVEAFADSYDALLANIEAKAKLLAAAGA